MPGSLGRAVGALESHPGAAMAYGHAQYFQADERPPALRTRARGVRVQSGAEWIRRRCRSGHSCISSPEAVVRTSVARRVGPYDPACAHTSDLNMWLRVAAVGDVAYVRGATQALYRIHSDSMLRSMLRDPGGAVHDLRERRAAFERFFAASGSVVPGAERMLATARRTLARQALWKASRGYDRGRLTGPDAVPVDDLVAFALETSPTARRLREWHGLQLRRRLGAGRTLLLFPPFLATGAAHRLRAGYNHWRLHRRGL